MEEEPPADCRRISERLLDLNLLRRCKKGWWPDPGELCLDQSAFVRFYDTCSTTGTKNAALTRKLACTLRLDVGGSIG